MDNKFIKRQVKNAFKQLKGLMKEVTLQDKVVTDFDFVHTEVIEGAPKVTIIKGLLYDQIAKEGNVVAKLVIESEDLANPDVYDKAVIDGTVWSITPEYISDGFTITLTITRVV